jgi:hypothetical protein
VQGDTIWVTSPVYRYGFSTVGASLVSAQMLHYPSLAEGRKGQPAELVMPGGHALLDYHLRVGGRDIDISSLPLVPEPAGDIALAEEDTARTVRFVHGARI